MTGGVSPLSLIVNTRVQFHASPCAIFGEKVAMKQVFIQILQFPLSASLHLLSILIHSTLALYNISDGQ